MKAQSPNDQVSDHATQRAQTWLDAFAHALNTADGRAAADLFQAQSFWRDLVAFSWNIVTAQGCDAIAQMLTATAVHAKACNFRVEAPAIELDGMVQAWFSFATATGHGRGHLRLKDGVCWTLLTTLQSLTGYEEKSGRYGTREMGVEHGVFRGRKSWLERREQEQAELGYTRQPYCLIVGGGQGGIALAARLKRLGVPALVIEKNPRAGDSWRNRYRSLCLHDPVWYDHMPYLPFPDHWPVFSPKDQIGDWLEMYTRVMELNYWASSRALRASYDETSATWRVVVDRQGEEIVLQPAHLVLATGMAGVPNIPVFPGSESFQGRVCHSSEYAGGEGYRGQRCVVIGSNNSAHDICADLWEQGADVTMVQRSSSLVAKSATLMQGQIRRLYSEDAAASWITTEIADLTLASTPYAVMPTAQIPEYERIAEQDADFYAALRRAGFLLDFGADGSGLYTKYLRYGAGYYIDVGASQLIIDGEIKLKSGVGVDSLNADSLTLTDGSELAADLIVCATGYGSMNGWAAQLISPQVAVRVGKCWGLGSGTRYDPGPWVGELRNMWKPTQQPGLWFHGGNLQQSRHYSLYLALQIKARLEGLETPVYGMPEVYHSE